MDKVRLLNRESALEYLPNLSKELGPEIYVKRDDEGGRGGGGNKLRKYERIIADAMNKQCNTLIIAGHYQSNAARELVAAACQLGLTAIVVCKEMIPEQNPSFNKNGNALLMSLMDATIVAIDNEADFDIEMAKVAEDVKLNGGKPYTIPFGGSNFLGSLGYVDCANEIINQFESISLEPPDYVFVPTGSGGTHAGLVSGFNMQNVKTKVMGVSVLHNKSNAQKVVQSLTTEILGKLKGKGSSQPDIMVDDQFVGAGYGIPTEKGIEAIRLVAKLEALFLCPIYTGKAMAGLIHSIREGQITAKDRVVFLHTGGTPMVYPYYDKYV